MSTRSHDLREERALVAWLGELFASGHRDLRVPIGDDAAVVRARGRALVATCDPVVEGVHFARGTPPAAIGRKAVNRNLSDLAAMGAHADWLLVSALLPHGLAPRTLRALFTGVRAAADAAGCAVIGGDVSATPGPLVLTVTALGHLAGRALRRDALRIGDTLHVTGPLGGSALGHHLRFRPHLSEGAWLARQRAVGAAIDVSDGLLLDLDRMLVASGGLGAELWEGQVPIAPAARRCARESGRSPLDHALGDGEDYVLLFSVRAGRRLPAGGPLLRAARAPIGRVTARPGLRAVAPDGTGRALAPSGFRHRV